MENIEQGNRLIAAFIGGIEHPENFWWKIAQKKNGSVSSDKLQYHTSWDWIMPVVEKIENGNKFRVAMVWNCCDICETENLYSNLIEVTGQKTKIEAVWKAVIEFITWYNQNKKQ